MFKFFARRYLTKLVYLLWFAVMSPPALLMVWLRDSYPRFELQFTLVGIPVAVASLFGGFWLATKNLHYMFDEGQMFLPAVKLTLSDLRMRMAFVPLLGAWFTPDEDKTKYEDEDR